MTRYVLDTNIVSFILKRDPRIRSRLEHVLALDSVFLGCPVVWYELQRGLHARDAKRQMSRLERLFGLL